MTTLGLFKFVCVMSVWFPVSIFILQARYNHFIKFGDGWERWRYWTIDMKHVKVRDVCLTVLLLPGIIPVGISILIGKLSGGEYCQRFLALVDRGYTVREVRNILGD